MNSVDAVHAASQSLAAAVVTVPPEKSPEHREIIQAVKAVNASGMFGANNELTFVLDRETRRAVVRIVDRDTNELIRQIPPEYLLRIAKDLKGAVRSE